ncbi:MAG: D-alanyl-D-alanine carboxypeptidase family protein [Clostridia bacterium]|nr:D-alanyl-D-alanine carboxypeptidase family protein [Clostridia bacterium]
MKNKVEEQMFDEFDFMYRHKKIVKEKQEAELREQQQREAEEKARAEAEAAALLAAAEENKKKPAKKKTPEKKEVKKQKTPEKKPEPKIEKTEPPKQKQEKKIHPKYGKPYKKDTESDRRRIPTKERKKLNKEYKKEREEIRKAADNRAPAETSAKFKAITTRVLLYVLAAAGAAIVIFGVSYGAMRFLLGYHKKAEHKNISYQVGLISDTVRVPYARLIRDGVIYVCGNDIVNLCGFTVTGTEEQIKYISPDSGNDTVQFFAGTNKAVINKNEIRLEADAVLEDKKLYIPMSFFTSYSTGIVCEYTPETEESRAAVKVYKKLLNEYEYKTSGRVPVYEPVTFRLKEPVVIDSIDERVVATDIKEVTYKIDISKYADAINPEKVYGYISVINADHVPEKEIKPGDLVELTAPEAMEPSPYESTVMLRKIAAEALEAMMLDIRGEADLKQFRIYSGYHSAATSEEEDPMQDESMLGLTVEAYFKPKDATYAGSETYKWFVENSYKYGFIIRYPKDKTDVTGVGFRPWTLRYVGRYAASKMREERLCLEEFIEEYDLEHMLTIKRTAE